MKKILFPFELNNPIYKEAFVYAVKLARNMSAKLIMLHVFDVDVETGTTREKYNALIKDKWYKAYSEVIKFNSYYFEQHVRIDNELRINFDYRFIHGKLQHEIRKIIGEESIDLLVLPVSDRKEINQRLLEIMRDDIFEKNRASLLVIPFNSVFKPISKIVFATGLRKINLFHLYLNDVVRFARIFDSSIHFLHISLTEKAFMPGDTEAYRSIMQIIKNNDRHSFTSLYGENVISAVNQYVEKNKADLLVVVKHQHYFLDSILHRSVSNEISLISQVPVLIMREKEA